MRHTLTLMRLSLVRGSRRASRITRPLLLGWRSSSSSYSLGSKRRVTVAPGSSGGMVTNLPCATWISSSSPCQTLPNGRRCSTTIESDAPTGRIADRHLAAAVAQLEGQALVVGHALVELGLCRDPVVHLLGKIDAIPQVVERALAIVDGRVAGQLGMVLEAVDAVLQPVVDAVAARSVAAEHRLHQLVGGVVFVRAIPAAQRPPFLVGGDHRHGTETRRRAWRSCAARR